MFCRAFLGGEEKNKELSDLEEKTALHCDEVVLTVQRKIANSTRVALKIKIKRLHLFNTWFRMKIYYEVNLNHSWYH